MWYADNLISTTCHFHSSLQTESGFQEFIYFQVITILHLKSTIHATETFTALSCQMLRVTLNVV